MTDNYTFSLNLMSGLPLKITEAKISVSRNCNLRCKKCFQWEKNSGEISFDDLSLIIDKLAQHDVKQIHFVGGEPILYSNIMKALAHAKEKKIKCGLTTNGQLIDERCAYKLKKKKIFKVFVSLDSHQNNIHDYIVGVKGAWERTISAIKALSRYHPKYIKHLAANYVITFINFRDICEYIKLIKTLGVNNVKFQLYESTGHKLFDRKFRLNKVHIDELNNNIIPSSIKLSRQYGMVTNLDKIAHFSKTGFISKMNKMQLAMPCFLPFYHIEIDYKGNIYPCCMMRTNKYLMGNIVSDGLDTVIFGEKFMKFKKGLLSSTKYPECRVCWDAMEDNLEITDYLRRHKFKNWRFL